MWMTWAWTTSCPAKMVVERMSIGPPLPPRRVMVWLFQYLCPDAAASLDDPKDGAAEQRPRNMQGAQVSASRLSLEELENTSHRHLLPKVNESRPVHVHLDTAHAGVGGVGEGGSKLWATATQFLINPKCGPWNFSVISPRSIQRRGYIMPLQQAPEKVSDFFGAVWCSAKTIVLRTDPSIVSIRKIMVLLILLLPTTHYTNKHCLWEPSMPMSLAI